MINYNRKEPLFALHIPKSGGTSFSRILKMWFHFGYHHHYYNHATGESPKPPNRLIWGLRKILPVCVNGHFIKSTPFNLSTSYPDAKQFISFVRDPLEMHLSAYNYNLQNFQNDALYAFGKKVEEFPYKDIDDYMVKEKLNFYDFFPWDLSLENYKDIIEENFVHIGVVERYEQSLKILSKKLNKWKASPPELNKSKVKAVPDRALVDQFIAENKLAYEIHEYACIKN